jgi:murein DD-endopeptidase MepM/ murein hydrolase activator NlpD
MQNSVRISTITKVLYTLIILAILTIGSPTPGLSQVTPDEEALREQISHDFPEQPRIINIDLNENYAFGLLVLVNDGKVEEGEGLSFIAKWFENGWHIYYEGSREFYDLITELPENLISLELKNYLLDQYKSISIDTSDEQARASGYKLPFCGKYYVQQDWDSHSGYVALDIKMALNSIITAAVAGEVVEIQEDQTACGCDDSLKPKGNFVKIRNIYGFYDKYIHLKQWGVIPAVGDQVYQGQAIGYSYKTGKTCGTSSSCDAGTCNVADCGVFAHLHFQVQDGNGNYYRPVFDDVGEVNIGWYTSGNCPDNNPPVSSLSLSGTVGENGYYISNVTATLSATDDISGVKSTHYNLNSAGWQIYSPPLVIPTNGRNTLDFYSIDNANHTEVTKSASPFYIDTVAPTNPTSITIGCSVQSDVWQNTCNDLYFTLFGASDATSGLVSYEYSWTGESGVVTPDSYYDPLPVSDGAYIFRVRVKDVAGIRSNWKTMFTLKYDATAPIGSIAIKDSWEVTNQALVNLDTPATDNASGVSLMRLRDSGGAWTDWLPYESIYEWVLPPQTGQTHVVEVQYQDQAGNISLIYADSIFLDIYPDHPTSQNFQLVKSTFGMSATDASSENFLLRGTLAQESASGLSGSENYQVISGYWGWMPEWIEFFLNFLPLMMN